MGASYFLTVRHKDLEGEGRAPYVWGIKQRTTPRAMNTQQTSTPSFVESYSVWALTSKGARFLGRYFTIEQMWAARDAYCKRHPRFGRTFQVNTEFKK